MFEWSSEAALVDAIGESARAENVACARRIAAIAELYRRRAIPVQDHQGRELWRIDPWAAVTAEVAAAQSITNGAADVLLHNAIWLHEHLPRVAAVFGAGDVDFRTVRMLVTRTSLAVEPEVMAAIDRSLAEAIPKWQGLSMHKTQLAADRIVARHDPEARRRTDTATRSRYLDIKQQDEAAYLNGALFKSDATLLDRRLTAMAKSTCENDPRDFDQRRADALGALAAGRTALVCACGSDGCTANEDASTPSIVVHVVAEAAVLDRADARAVHGERPEDETTEIVTSRERLVEVIREAATAPKPSRPKPIGAPAFGLTLGGPDISANILADLAARGLAELRPVVHPGDSPPEPRYRPSQALADFVRCRDLTCRFPGCDVPADLCDIDHTIPYAAGGPTHASNLTCKCRKHHLLKTFWCGPDGWRDEQLPDGTLIWTSPSGRTYRTEPGSKLVVPSLCIPTGTLNIARREQVSVWRGAMMPTRRRTRADDRLRRIMAERNHNRQLGNAHTRPLS